MSGRFGKTAGESARPVGLEDVDDAVRRTLLRHTLLRTVAVAAILIGSYYLLPDRLESAGGVVFRIAAGLVLLVGVLGWALRSVLRAQYPQLRAIEAFSLALSALIVVFAFGYLSMSANDADAFEEPLSHTDALYFTLTTVTTVGFGDIAPESDAARGLVMVQMVLDFVLIGAGIRLLALVAKRRLEAAATSAAERPPGPVVERPDG